jgi:hypothetical protein
MTSPNLAIPHVAAAQAQKEVTINQAVDLLDRALTDVLAVDLGAGDVTLTSDQYRRHTVFRAANVTASRTLTLPQIKRTVAVDNADGAATLTVARGTGTVSVPAGAALAIYTDGSANGIRPIGGTGGGGGASNLADLDDVALTGLGSGDLIQYDGTAWVNVPGAILNRVMLPFRGALAQKTSTQSIAANTDTPVSFQGTLYDTDGFWSAANPTRLTVPAGVTKVIVSANVRLTGGSGNNQLKLTKNGADMPGTGNVSMSSGFTTAHMNATTAVLNVAPGDWFEAVAFSSVARTIDSGERTWLALAVVETTDAANPPADWPFRRDGSPGASEVVLRAVLARRTRFAAALAGSVGHAGTAATAQTDFDVRRNGASIGTIRFPAGAATATFIAASAVVFEPGDRLTVLAPATPDATLADIAVTLAGALVV